jgi:hypothetical protein
VADRVESYVIMSAEPEVAVKSLQIAFTPKKRPLMIVVHALAVRLLSVAI